MIYNEVKVRGRAVADLLWPSVPIFVTRRLTCPSSPPPVSVSLWRLPLHRSLYFAFSSSVTTFVHVACLRHRWETTTAVLLLQQQTPCWKRGHEGIEDEENGGHKDTKFSVIDSLSLSLLHFFSSVHIFVPSSLWGKNSSFRRFLLLVNPAAAEHFHSLTKTCVSKIERTSRKSRFSL